VRIFTQNDNSICLFLTKNYTGLMNIVNRINAFAKLGDILRNPDASHYRSFKSEIIQLHNLILSSANYNPWFTSDNVKNAISAIGQSLKTTKVEKWLCAYHDKKLEPFKPNTIGVVMAGNIPLVGFHDFMSVLMSGQKILAKLSSDDKHLLPLLAKILVKIEPEFGKCITFTTDKLENFNAIIATGSNNTSRYFDYYFGKYPHIIRKNRNGVTVLTGNETSKDLFELGKDIFWYFGLGCRNVSKMFVPKGYNFDKFFQSIEDYKDLINHSKYVNNYDYNKSIFLVNKVAHLDNGFLLLTEETALSSPISVVYFEEYTDFGGMYNNIQARQEHIQCVVSIDKKISKRVEPGRSQMPELWDYADGVDTMKFLLGLK
jgi:hypothetical protein